MLVGVEVLFFFFFKQKTAYEMRISDWSSDVCSSDLLPIGGGYIAPAWVSQVGAKRAKELAFLPGNHVDGRTAEAWGWANAAVPAAQLIACVEAVAARIAKILAPRLEERRVGKVCVSTFRSRWSPYHSKNTQFNYPFTSLHYFTSYNLSNYPIHY